MKNEKIIADRLKYAGVPVSLLGYEYLKVAISKVLDNPPLIHSITTQLIPCVLRSVAPLLPSWNGQLGTLSMLASREATPSTCRSFSGTPLRL